MSARPRYGYFYDGPAVQARRKEILDACAKRGISVTREGTNGAWHLQGRNLDILVADLAIITELDLMPCQ